MRQRSHADADAVLYVKTRGRGNGAVNPMYEIVVCLLTW